MGRVIQFPSTENQEQDNTKDQYKEYYCECNEHDRRIFEMEQYISDEELAIQYFKREQDKLEDMVKDMEKELVTKKKELQELKNHYISCVLKII